MNRKMNFLRSVLLVVVFFLAMIFSVRAAAPDSLLWRVGQGSVVAKESPSIVQFGVRVGVNVKVGDFKYSARDLLKRLSSAEFGAFVRVGKHVYVETGLSYMFHKGTYSSVISDTLAPVTERVETRYLQVPLKLVGYIPLGKQFALLPHAGVIYQPLIGVTKNDIGFKKENISQHQLLFSGGIGAKLSFVLVEVAYKRSFFSFFSDRKSANPSFIAFTLGVQF